MDVLSYLDKEKRDFSSSRNNFTMSVYDKKRLKLDLPSKVKKQDTNNAVLTSPDLIKLKLDSPELERIILATAGSATPTPKQYRRIKESSDLTVREQQEQYVRGFEDALHKMREESDLTQINNDVKASTVSALILNNNNNVSKVNHENEIPSNQAANDISNAVVKTSSHQVNQTHSSSNNINTISGFQSTKYISNFPVITVINRPEPTTDTVSVERVKGTSFNHQPDDITAGQLLFDPVATTKQSDITEFHGVATTSYPTLSAVPIDLHKQEVVKTERKKHRNRVAASKCRKRKLERESHLQERVNELKSRHSELSNIASILRQQVCELKLQVMDHIKSGCEVLPIAAM